jgi:hypothetical protein
MAAAAASSRRLTCVGWQRQPAGCLQQQGCGVCAAFLTKTNHIFGSCDVADFSDLSTVRALGVLQLVSRYILPFFGKFYCFVVGLAAYGFRFDHMSKQVWFFLPIQF